MELLKLHEGRPLRLFLELFAPVALLIVGGAWFIAQDRINEALDLVRSDEANNVVLGVRRLDGEMQRPLQQLRELARDSSVQAALNGDVQPLRSLFINLVTYNPDYDKVRWLDENGHEKLRSGHVDNHVKQVTEDQLQDVSASYYFKAASRLTPGQIYVSPLDLNTENGRVEEPYKPVLRLATPLVDKQGKRRGVLIININAGQLLDRFTESMGNKRDHIMLVNADGYWLQSNNPNKDWGFMFKRDDTLAKNSPVAWQMISKLPSSQAELAGDDTNNGMWTWSTAYPLTVERSQDVGELPYWLVISRLPQSQLTWISRSAWNSVTGPALLLLLVYAGIAFWLSKALRDRSLADLEVVKAHAETQAAQRVADANERFHMMVEANANGLLVADSEGRIVFVNPALASMFGYEREALLKQPIEVLLPESVRGGHVGMRNAYIAAPEARAMGMGRELLGQRKDGSVFPIEISLSFFTENGRQFVDALVADLSSRTASLPPRM